MKTKYKDSLKKIGFDVDDTTAEAYMLGMGEDDALTDPRRKNEGVIKAFSLGTSEGGTKQLESNRAQKAINAVTPPYNLFELVLLSESSSRLTRCIQTFAQNTAGLGWKLPPKIELPELSAIEDDDDNQKAFVEATLKAIQEETLLVKNVLDHPNDRMSWTQLLKLVKIDQKAVGNGYIEVIRNLKGNPSQFFHTPGHTIRVLTDRSGFVQKRGGKVVYFKCNGDPRIMDCKTGKLYEDIDAANTADLKIENHATELIHILEYSARSSYYGIPLHVSAVLAIKGNRLAAESNFFFFDNNATPRGIIIVKNGRLDPQSFDNLTQFVTKENRGVENTSRLLILQAASKEVNIGETSPDEDTGIEYIEISHGKGEDAGWQNYRKNNDEEIREVFGIDKSFFTTEGVNRASSITGRRITIDNVFIPDIIEMEHILDHQIMGRNGFNVKHIQFKLNRPEVIDTEAEAKNLALLSRTGGVTGNDVRMHLGKEKFAGKFGDLPLQVVMALLSSGNVSILGDDEITELKDASNAVGKAMLDSLSKRSAISDYEGETTYDADMNNKVIEALCNLDDLLEERLERKVLQETDPDSLEGALLGSVNATGRPLTPGFSVEADEDDFTSSGGDSIIEEDDD